MVTLKEYAKNKGISYEAVRKQVARYREALGDHIVVNGKTQYLDEDAVNFLDSKRAVNAVHIIEHDKDEQIEELQRQNENMRLKIMELQDQLIKSKDQLLERDQQLLDVKEQLHLITEKTSEEKEKQPEEQSLDKEESQAEKKWWKFWKN